MAKKKTTTKSAKAPGARRAASSSSSASETFTPTAAMRVVVLFGKESMLRQLHTEKLADAIKAAHGEVDIVRFDGESAAVADVLDECRSFGLMQQHKLVVVDDADEFLNEHSRPLVERYAESPAQHATLVLRADIWRAGNLDKKVAKVGAVVKCEPLGVGRATKWAVQRCGKEHNALLDPDAAEALIERLGVDLGRIDSELAKLASAAGAEGRITLESVRELVGRTREEAAWDLQSVLLGRDPEASLQTVANMIGPSRLDPVFLTFVCGDLARKLHTVSRLLRQGTPPFQAARQAKIWGAGEHAIIDAARRAHPDDLADLLDATVDADRRMKSGQADALRTLEGLAIRFASV